MKPLSLELQAFGPFPDRANVDFAALGDSAFFLIHGPTGAGKTTLLDAICFALYGDTSGGEREPRAMRSSHADAAMTTRVVFEFALGDARYRVERSPEQEKPKQRGQGTVQIPAKAQLDRWEDGAWKSLESQHKKVTDRIEELLGFSSAQFRQVIVLPQGRFRELLTADSKTRQAILQHLFQTEIYRRLEEALKAEAGSIELAARELAAEQKGIFSHAQVTNDDELATRAEELAVERTQADEQLSSAKQRDVEARTALQVGRAIEAKLAEHAGAVRAHAEIAAQDQATAASRATSSAGRRAMLVMAAESGWRATAAAADDASQRLTAATVALHEAVAEAQRRSDALVAEEALAASRTEAAQRVAMLEGIAEKLTEAAKSRAQIAVASAERQRDEAAREALVEKLGERERAAAQTHVELEGARTAAAPREALALQYGAAVQDARRGTELASARAEELVQERSLRDATTALEHATAALTEARAHARATERAWSASQAAILASSLRNGSACLVCGSTEHPNPAHAGAETVGDSALTTAREHVGTIERALAEATLTAQRQREQVAALRVRIEERRASLGPLAEQPLEALEERAASLAQAEGVARAAHARAATLTEQHTRILAEVEATRRDLEALRARLADGERALARMHGELDAQLARAPAELRDPAALEEATVAARGARDKLELSRRTAAEANARALEALAAARARHASDEAAAARQQSGLEGARVRFDEAMATASFTDEATYRAALRTREALDALEKAIAEHDSKRAAATDRLARAAEAARDLVTPDLVRLEEAVSIASNAVESAVGARQAIASRIEIMERARETLRALSARARDIEARYAVLGRLAEVANGKNPRGVNFQRFVLATLLDEVLEAASLRLRRMSRNRYELLRVTERGDQRTASGLEVDVLDHHSGTRRPGNTLSGGEGFLASLSLALGLADVVQARAGGVQLQTLFVDEGFGSLDPESLDFAIRTLVDLQQAGRMVGIISHVAELTERIDVRLEIKTSVRGSTLAWHLP